MINFESKTLSPNLQEKLYKSKSLFRFKIRKSKKIKESLSFKSKEDLSVINYLLLTMIDTHHLLDINLMITSLFKKEIFKNVNFSEYDENEDKEFFIIDIDYEFLQRLIVLEKRNYSICYDEFIDNNMQINLDDIDQCLVLLWLFTNMVHSDCYIPFLFIYNVSINLII